MNFTETGIFQKQKVRIKNLLPEIGIDQARNEIIAGLQAKIPYVSSKYFYDKAGSELFEEITELEEYYPTRTEKKIINNIASQIMGRNKGYEIIELGSGDCSKISLFLDAVNGNGLEHVEYIPVDFSYSAVEKSAIELSNRYPDLKVSGYVADFIHQLHQIPHSQKPRLIFFLGSTIGNFSKTEAKEMLKNLAFGLREGDSLLVGFDLVKPEEVLHAAYNDSQNVTKRFNRNILNVVNRIIDSDFHLEDFDHVAAYYRDRSRIEMHLKARLDLEINSPWLNEPLCFKKGDLIHTENSHKFTSELIQELLVDSELIVKNKFSDSNDWFALFEFERKS